MLHLTISGYNLYLSAERPHSSDALGECQPLPTGDYAIRVSEELNDRAFTDTVFHEILEAVDCIYDLGLEHNQIQTLGVALSQLAPDAFTSMLRTTMAPTAPSTAKAKRVKKKR